MIFSPLEPLKLCVTLAYTYEVDARKPHFPVLQAASRILNDRRPNKRDIEVVATYADSNIPEGASLPIDELAVVVALKLMGIQGDPTEMKENAR